MFSINKSNLGRTDVMEHSLSMRDQYTVFTKQFHFPESHRSVLITHMQNWIKVGVDSPSHSHFNLPIFCVPKKDGTLRPVLDFRAINEKSCIDKYSQREVQDCIDEIGRAQLTVGSNGRILAITVGQKEQTVNSFSIPVLVSFEWN